MGVLDQWNTSRWLTFPDFAVLLAARFRLPLGTPLWGWTWRRTRSSQFPWSGFAMRCTRWAQGLVFPWRFSPTTFAPIAGSLRGFFQGKMRVEYHPDNP